MLLRTIKSFSSPLWLAKNGVKSTTCPPVYYFAHSPMDAFKKKLAARNKSSQTDEIRIDTPEPQQDSENSKEEENYIPQNFVLRHLYWPPTKASVLVLGVDRRDAMHASFLQDIMTKSDAQLMTMQLSPDEPFFVRTSGDYRKAWKKFLTGNFDQRFFVNPSPQYLADIILDEEKIKMFMEGPIMQTPDVFEVGPTFIYSECGILETDQLVDCFLQPVLFSYNNPEKQINLVINDVPILTQRDFLARRLSKRQLKDLLDQYIDSLSEDNEDFDPRILIPEAFIHPRIAYITETLRQSCYVNKKIIAILDYNFVDLVEDEWKKLGPNMRNLVTCLTPHLPKNANLTYTEYIEKQVMLDLIQEPFIKNNFIHYRSFPFNGKDTIGQEVAKNNIFLIWKHYFQRHAKLINERPASFEDVRNSSKIDVSPEFDNLNNPQEDMIHPAAQPKKRSK